MTTESKGPRSIFEGHLGSCSILVTYVRSFFVGLLPHFALNIFFLSNILSLAADTDMRTHTVAFASRLSVLRINSPGGGGGGGGLPYQMDGDARRLA